jgi:hypothetical protein
LGWFFIKIFWKKIKAFFTKLFSKKNQQIEEKSTKWSLRKYRKGKLMRNSFIKELSSFRDPSGYIFYKDDIVYRSISYTYKDNYDMLMNSGLYKALVEKKLMIPHSEVQLDGFDDNCYKIIKPEQIQFISYPYEWCFSQLKDASLITLQIQKIALDFGMILKDASAYNIQFKDGRPSLLILFHSISMKKKTMDSL